MWHALVVILAAMSALYADTSLADEDVFLRKVIRAYEVKPLTSVARALGPKERLGQALFFDPVISGPKNIACATCHVRSLGAGDGLPLAIGLGGGAGVSKERLSALSAFIIPRNALPLFNRGSDDFVAFFWDGRVQLGTGGQFESPLGGHLPSGFNNLLAVASVFPLAEPDEMLGRSARRVGQSAYHAELVGDEVDAENYRERTLSAFRNVVRRLLAPEKTEPSAVVIRYRELFKTAYPGVELTQFGIQHVGNALSAYIAAAFELQPSDWDRYVAGQAEALTKAQKKGALIFYGKGRCAVCHTGRQFSDFRFHGLAVPQGSIGKHGRYVDYGRAAATGRGEDRFSFRTPPLRNVTSTGPWGHNGIFDSIEAMIEHHSNPVAALYAAQKYASDGVSESGRLLSFRSRILGEMPPLSKEDIQLLRQFLDSLSSPTTMSDPVALPEETPSDSKAFVRH